MNAQQLYTYLYKNNYHLENIIYRSPEYLSTHSIIGSHKEIAPFVLYQNRNSFKDRIENKISDNWLSKDTFKDIYKYLIEILENIDDKEEYQCKLLQIFLSFEKSDLTSN